MSKIQDVVSLFKLLQNTSGKNDKIKIIKKNSDNNLFKKCLVFLADPNIVTGISTKKLEKGGGNISVMIPPMEFEQVMDYLLMHNTGADSDIAYCRNLIDMTVNEDEKDFYVQMITKKLRLGCDVKTINAAIPNLIKTWEVQQAYPISEKNAPKNGEWYSLSQKLNGNNCGAIGNKTVSRQGKEFSGLNHILEDIHKLSFKGMFFNGELIRKNPEGLPDDENFQLGTGIINSDDKDKTCIKFVIYEMIPEDEFKRGISKLKYKDRLEQYLIPLENEIKNLGLKNIEVVERVYQGRDSSMIQKYLAEADAKGWEGLMLNKNDYWKNKRHNGILKVKTFHHCDVFCKDIVEGDGKFKGMLGNIICDYKGYDLGVGSGFTDEQRKYYWKHPENIVDKIVTVKYKTETKNKDGGLSVQFPTFCVVRNDKTEVSYF